MLVYLIAGTFLVCLPVPALKLDDRSDVGPLVLNIPGALYLGCKTFQHAHQLYVQAFHAGTIEITPITNGPYDNPYVMNDAYRESILEGH